MRTSQLVRTTAMLAAFVMLGGCMSTKGPGKVSVNTIEGAYQAPKTTALPNDIKTILAAGGLDLLDPSAPVEGTKIAEMATSKRTGDVENLIAALSDDENKKQQAVPVVVAAKTSGKEPPAMLSLVAEEKTPAAVASAPIRFEAKSTTETFSYPEIGVPPSPDTRQVVAAMSEKEPRRRAPTTASTAAKPSPANMEPKRPRRF